MERGVALLGFAAIGSSGLVLLATRTRPAAVLPGGHVVRLVTESRWIAVPLQARPRKPLPCILGGAASCRGDTALSGGHQLDGSFAWLPRVAGLLCACRRALGPFSRAYAGRWVEMRVKALTARLPGYHELPGGCNCAPGHSSHGIIMGAW